jgi:hypothetical protein
VQLLIPPAPPVTELELKVIVPMIFALEEL